MTGVRVGELLGLRWSNLDSCRGELSITHSLWRRELVTPKTDASVRTIHLHEVLTNFTAEHQEGARFHSSEDFVFGRVDGYTPGPS